MRTGSHARADTDGLVVLVEPAPSDGAQMAAIVDSGFVSMVAIDLDGTIVKWNRAAERLFGWRSSEVLGRSIDFIVPEDRQDEIATMISTLRRGDDVSPIETVRRAKDGTDLQVYVQVSAVVDPFGSLIGASKLLFDRAEQAAARAALAASEARYLALVDALTEFVIVTNARGEVASAQPSWFAYTGQDQIASGQLGWLDVIHPHDRGALERQWADGTTVMGPFRVSGRLMHRSGEYRQCEGRVAPIRDSLGRVVEWVAAFSDVHERHLAEERERNTADRFRRIFAANVFGICYGEQRQILEANDVMLEMLGARRRDLRAGISVERVVIPTELPDPSQPLGNGEAREFQIKREDGSTGYLLAAGVSLAPDPGWIAVAVDITQRKASERDTEHRALHDALTGLPNRRLLVDRLEHALTRSNRQETPVGVLFCDLDHFKEINDVFGHAGGDFALQSVARRLNALLRECDTVARSGGDEFVVLLEDLTDPDDAALVAERVRAALSAPVNFEGREIRVTCSIGVALSNGTDDRVEGLISRADDAMYRAKQEGRDQVALVATEKESRSERRWIERELKRALTENTLELAFQPVIDLRDGRPVGAEALLRWQVNGEPISTARTVEVAEETGIIMRLSDWVLRAACRQFSAWRAANPAGADWKLHINISARDLGDERFIERVLDGIEAGGCVPSDICLELTETTMLRHPERAHARLEALRTQGVSIAIDDFGAGYASLGILRDVPADIVKIDRSLVADLTNSERDQAIVGHAIELAHQLGLIVVAEGVETSAQKAILGNLGCDQGQGYVFARPKPVADLTASIG